MASSMRAERLLFPSAIVCSCSKHFESEWSEDDTGQAPEQRQRSSGNDGALALFLRHRAHRLAAAGELKKPHSAAIVLLPCIVCQVSVDINQYRQHLVKEHHQTLPDVVQRYRQVADYARPPVFECDECLERDEFCRLDIASLLEHSHPDSSAFELYLSCRECGSKVPLCDAVGHAAFMHAELLSGETLADLYVTDLDSALPFGDCHFPDDDMDSPTPTASRDANASFPIDEQDHIQSEKFEGSSSMIMQTRPPAPPGLVCDEVLQPAAAAVGQSVAERHKELPPTGNRQGDEIPPTGIGQEIYNAAASSSDMAASQKSSNESRKSDTERAGRYPCTFCKKTFARSVTRITHELKFHAVDDDRAHDAWANERRLKRQWTPSDHGGPVSVSDGQCNICGSTFQDKNYLTMHVRTVHHGERPFPCPQCGHCFSQRGNLRVHMRTIHHGERPFPCHMCERAFRQKSSLQSHLLQHSRPAPPPPLPLEGRTADTAAVASVPDKCRLNSSSNAFIFS